MDVKRVNNVNFGYRMTPKFVENFASGLFTPGKIAEKLAVIRKTGNDNILLDFRSGILGLPRELMIFPKKYKFNIEIDAHPMSRNYISELTSAEKRGITQLLSRAVKKGNLKEMAEALLVDFPHMKKHIDKISQNSIYLETAAGNAQKTIFTRIKEFFIG